MVKVDDQAFRWLGGAGVSGLNSTTLLSSTVTPTKTTLSVQAGPVILNATFLSPIEVNRRRLQLFPHTYSSSTDFRLGQAVVAILIPICPSIYYRWQRTQYSIVYRYNWRYVFDLSVEGSTHGTSIEWVSGASNGIQWDTTQTNDAWIHQVQRSTPAAAQEIAEMSEDSTVYYAMSKAYVQSFLCR